MTCLAFALSEGPVTIFANHRTYLSVQVLLIFLARNWGPAMYMWGDQLGIETYHKERPVQPWRNHGLAVGTIQLGGRSCDIDRVDWSVEIGSKLHNRRLRLH
jgi:hypothetical protein